MKKRNTRDGLETIAAYTFVILMALTAGGIVGYMLSHICQ